MAKKKLSVKFGMRVDSSDAGVLVDSSKQARFAVGDLLAGVAEQIHSGARGGKVYFGNDLDKQLGEWAFETEEAKDDD